MDEERVSALYRRYGPVIYALCRRMLGDAGADDATQETFMRVHQHLDKAPDEAIGWIYRIATNYCLTELRDRRTRPSTPNDQTADETVGSSLEELLANRDLVARIVARAPDKLRVVAWMHHVDGIAQGEVARLLDISRRTVVSRLAAFGDLAQRDLERNVA